MVAYRRLSTFDRPLYLILTPPLREIIVFYPDTRLDFLTVV